MDRSLSCTVCACPTPFGVVGQMCVCGHSVTRHGNGQVYCLQPRYCRTSGASFQSRDGEVFTSDQTAAARLPCVLCSQAYFMHALSPEIAPSNSSAAPSTALPPSSAASSSTAPPPSAPTSAWTMSGTFSGQNTTLERVRSAQPSAFSSTTSSFRPWDQDSSFNNTATTNDRRTNAAQRHQPTPQGLPAPARGVAQNPLLPLPTIALPRVTGTRSVRNPRLQAGAQVSSLRSHKSKIFDYKFACVILPIGVNGFTSKNGSSIQSQSIRAPSEGKSRLFYTKAEHLRLSFIFRLQASPEELIVNTLNECLKSHMDLFELKQLVEKNPQSHLFSPTSTSSLSPDFPWQILYAKQTQRSACHTPALNVYPAADMKKLTFKKLGELMVNRQGDRRIPAVTIDDEPHQLLLIVPTYGIIVGPLKGHEGKFHECLSERLWFGFREVDMNEGIDKDAPTCNSVGLSCEETGERVRSPSLMDYPMDEESFPFHDQEPTNAVAGPSMVAVVDIPCVEPPEIPIDPQLLALENNPLPISASAEPMVLVDESDQREVFEVFRDALEQSLQDGDNESPLTITSTTTDKAVDALYPRLRALYFKESSDPLPPSDDTSILNLDIKALDGTKIVANIGEAVGYGPTRATWSAMIDRVVTNPSQWMEAADGYYTPVNMIPFSVTPADEDDFEFCGFLLRQSLIWGLDPFPISPFFIALVLADLKAAMSPEFIKTVSPLSAQRLATWPPVEITNVENGAVFLDLDYRRDPMKLLVSCLEFTQIDRIRAMLPAQRQMMTPFIKYVHLFRVTLQSENKENSLLDPTHPILLAFKKGLLQPQVKTQLDLHQVLVGCIRPIDLVVSLYAGRQIFDPEQVIERIEVKPVSKEAIGYDEDIHHHAIVKRFTRLLYGYIRGLGHPKGSTKLGVSETAIESNKADKFLRSQFFVQALTASGYLPIHNGKISIQMMSLVPPAGSTSSAIVSNSAAVIHTCFCSMDVFITKHVATKMLAYEDDEVSQETVDNFEDWIHSLVFPTTEKKNEFNEA